LLRNYIAMFEMQQLIWSDFNEICFIYKSPLHNAFWNFLSNTIPRPSGWTQRSNCGWWRQVEKKYPGVSGCSIPDGIKKKSAFQVSWFSCNQWFCLEITNRAVTLNFVKELYLIVCDATTNLIKFHIVI